MAKPKKKKTPPPQASPDSLMKRMMKEHIDLLQNVEFIIVQCSRDIPEFDDAAAAQGLRCMIRNEEPQDDRAVELIGRLLDWEEERPDIPDRLWADAYRVVLDSVHNRSTLQPGNRDYLKFIANYVK